MEIKVAFTEKLDRLTCASLLVETVKYLLYQRYQMPWPFDQLKAEDERERKSGNARRSPRNCPLPSVLKKKRQFIADTEELLVNIYKVFVENDVSELLLLFGATVVNPKEMYSIRFCNIARTSEADKMKVACLEGKENSLNSRSKFVDKCCRKLARTLFMDPFLNERGELGCTSVHCFILAPRSVDVSWLRPKASFRVPKKGKSFEIGISGGGDGHTGTLDGNDGEERTAADNNGQLGSSESGLGTLGDYDSEQDILWFKAPVVIKGYKEAYKETLESSMWRK